MFVRYFVGREKEHRDHSEKFTNKSLGKCIRGGKYVVSFFELLLFCICIGERSVCWNSDCGVLLSYFYGRQLEKFFIGPRRISSVPAAAAGDVPAAVMPTLLLFMIELSAAYYGCGCGIRFICLPCFHISALSLRLLSYLFKSARLAIFSVDG